MNSGQKRGKGRRPTYSIRLVHKGKSRLEQGFVGCLGVTRQTKQRTECAKHTQVTVQQGQSTGP